MDEFKNWKSQNIKDVTTEFSGDGWEEKAKNHLRNLFPEFEESSIEYFFNCGLPLVREKSQQTSFVNVEKYMSTRFNVLHVVRDYRGDEGDDAGWIVLASEKDSKFYLHVIFVSTNSELNRWIFTEEEFEAAKDKKQISRDFKVFDTLDEVQNEVDRFVKLLNDNKDFIEDEYIDFWDDEYVTIFEEHTNQTFSENDIDWLRAFTTTNFEYHKVDMANLTNLTKTQYIPNFVNEWDEEDK